MRVFIHFAICLGLVAPALAQTAGSASLTIRVENVSPRGGILRLGVYDEARYPDNKSVPAASADVKAVKGATVIVLHNIPPGIYAIETYQDINADGKMDKNWMGLPQEPFGFSRDARPTLSKPAFAKVAITLTAGANMQVIQLQNSIWPLH